ncbi:MAG TPA: hypothetical protein VFW68_01745 [Rhodocyclaceae bacterium]|nr:hypothetical protein [Rhodocyclaceae bacterium]
MATPTVADYLKYANLQMAAEALYDFNATLPGVVLTPGAIFNDPLTDSILTDGNLHASKFTPTEATLSGLTSDWVVVEHKSNTTTGFSGTLFKNQSTNELVLSFRSTEFIDDAARDNTATNTLEIKDKGFAFGQIDDMEVWYKHLTNDGLIPAGAKYSVTGYSLGGHLATAFNLLRQEDGTQGRVDNVYTFNGAGVGSVTQGTLGSVMQYFKDLRKDSAQVDATIDNVDLLSTYQTLRAGLTDGSLTLPQAKAMIDGFPIPSSLTLSPDSLEYKALIEDKTRISLALDRAIKVHDAAHYAPTLSAESNDTSVWRLAA